MVKVSTTIYKIFLGGGIFLIICSICYLMLYRSFFSINRDQLYNEEVVIKSNVSNNTDTLFVGVIGDSYALRQKYRKQLLEDCLQKEFGDKVHIRVQIEALGGRQSDSLLHGCNTQFRELLECRPDYCVVFGGINDVFQKEKRKSPSYYAHNMMQIFEKLTKLGITPIACEIPHIRLDMTRVEHYLISYEKQKDFIQRYRDAFRDSIDARNFEKILLLELNTWTPSVNHEIFEDIVHLNDNGYVALDKAIANLIAADF